MSTHGHGTVKDKALPPLPARSIGPYELATQLSSSSVADVFLARREGLERMFALKLLQADLPEDAVERSRRGAQLAANLTHPGIVRPVDIGTHQGRLYVVTDHVPGVTLKERLQQGPIPWREAVELVAVLADALEVAHREGVVHRNLRPSTIVIDGRDQKPKIMDFGLARDFTRPSSITTENQTIGAHRAMPPEQIRGEAVDGRADVYALGVLLYQMIAGEPPFQGANFEELLAAIQAGPAKPLEKLTAAPELDSVLRDALAAKPAGRPKTAGELARRLRQATGLASRETGSSFTRSFIQMAPPGLLLPLMALWVVVLGGITGWAVWEHRQRRDLRQQLLASQDAQSRLTREASTRQAELTGHTERLEALRVEREDLRGQHQRLREENRRLVADKAALEIEARQLRKKTRAPARPAPARATPLLIENTATPQVIDWVIEKLADNPKAQLLRAQLLHNRGRFREALEVIAAARKAGDDDPRLKILEGRTFYKTGNPQRGARIWAEVARESPDSVEGLFARAVAAEGNTLELLRKAARKGPKVSYLRVMLSSELLKQGTQDRRKPNADLVRESIRVADQAVKADPSSWMACWQRSLARYTLWVVTGRRDRSLAGPTIVDLRLARALRPDPRYWILAGKSYLEMLKQPANAIPELIEGRRRADLVTGKRGLGNRIESRYFLGAALLMLRQESKAVDVWLQGVKIAPNANAAYGFVRHLRGASPQAKRRVLEAVPARVRPQIQRILSGRRGRRGGG